MKSKIRKPRKLKFNPAAKALSQNQFRLQVKPSAKRYKRQKEEIAPNEETDVARRTEDDRRDDG
jgi:hypothetical protein